MLSRREKLLVRPWQQKRYENHLRKVQSALPVIDNRPPPNRNHVALKLKSKQSENERCLRIEKDNFILLQKLSYIMRTNRIDNYWATPQPNFLNRIGLYDTSPKNRSTTETSQNFTKEPGRIRQAKCLGCTPHKVPEPQIPEERVPWEPEKPLVRRIRSKSVPVLKVTALPIMKEVSSISLSTPYEKQSQKEPKKQNRRDKSYYKKDASDKYAKVKSPQSIILSRGSLVLAVNFPPDTLVKFQDRSSEKLILRGLCQCKNDIKKNAPNH